MSEIIIGTANNGARGSLDFKGDVLSVGIVGRDGDTMRLGYFITDGRPPSSRVPIAAMLDGEPITITSIQHRTAGTNRFEVTLFAKRAS